MRSLIKEDAFEQLLTIVPIPPSKTRTHPDYDDRIYRICTEMVAGLHTPDVKELIRSTEDMEATHNQDVKPPPNELMAHYEVAAEPGYTPRQTVLLVDDMLTTGTHFKACKQLLIEAYPGIQVIGLFITRRVFINPFEDLL
ncbi:MAG: phosphoribosyltransferase [gamma proteobacterium symbiont of Clathrolucina costata]